MYEEIILFMVSALCSLQCTYIKLGPKLYSTKIKKNNLINGK